jgi:hypothetical protein
VFVFVLIITTQSQKTDRAATVSFISNAPRSFRAFVQLYCPNLYYRLEFVFVLIIKTQSQKTDRAATVSFISNTSGSFRVFAQLYYRNLYYRNFRVSQLC